MSVPPSNQDGSFPDQSPDFLPPSGEGGPNLGTYGLGEPYQQYGQAEPYPPNQAGPTPEQYPTNPPTGSLPGQYQTPPPTGPTPGQPPFPSPATTQNPYNPPAQPADGPQPYPPTEYTEYSAQGYPPEGYPPQSYPSAPGSPYTTGYPLGNYPPEGSSPYPQAGYPPQGYPDARYPNQTYPPAPNSPYPQAQPYASHGSTGQPPYPYPAAAQPTTWSWAKRVGTFWLVAFVVFAVFFATRGLWPTSRPTSTYTSAPSSPTTTSPQPSHTTGPELPIVLDPAPVVQAIDLPEQPTLGEGWNATDGLPANDGMMATPIITPCGVLVTFLEPNYDSRVESGKAPPEADQSRIVGYEIATGTRLWTMDFQDATGQRDPEPDYKSPTYTPDCRMIFMSRENAYRESDREYVVVMVDLATGEVSSYHSEYLYDCQAVDNDWAACWTLNEVFLMSLSDFTKSPQSAAQLSYRDGTEEYLRTGGLAISGYTWTPAGYRDPSSGDIVFGKDTHAGATYGESKDGNWVMYVEPTRPGAYRSGLVLRVEGSLFVGQSTCKAMLWDPISDTGLWDAPGEFPCGDESWGGFLFVATQTALLIKTPADDGDILNAYALSDGHFIWQQEGILSGGDDSLQFRFDSASGITNDFATFVTPIGYDYVIRRVHDGADVLSAGDFAIFSHTMFYVSELSSSSYKYCVAAYSLDPDNPSTTAQLAWSIPLADDWLWWWTFATDGKMYLVTREDDTEALTVRPLIP